MRRAGVVMMVTVLTVSIAGGAPGQTPFPDDTLAVVKEEAGISNVDVAVALSGATFADAGTVVVSRDDAFADALASGVMQRERPLLLVPREGPLPPQVRSELQRLAPSSAVVLGGTAAVSAQVEAELQDLGLSTERRAGGSRIETAIAVAAAEAPAAETAILARAFGADGTSDPSQGFADTLAGGGMAARTGWPILLTQTEALSPATRDYLEASQVRRVEILGGTAAIGTAVEEELRAMGITTERLAGATRADTAVAIADKLGSSSADDVDRVVLVQGQTPDAWAGGFAAAAHSAAFDAPIVLATGDQLPQATLAWLQDGAPRFAQDPEGIRLTCVTVPSVCEQARQALGLPPAGLVVADPPPGSTVDAAQPISATLTMPAEAVAQVTVTGSCLGTENTSDLIRPERTGTLPGATLTLAVSAAVPAGPCEFSLRVQPVQGEAMTAVLGYTASGGTRVDLLSAGPTGAGAGGVRPTTSADGSTTAFASDGQVVAGVAPGQGHVYAVVDGVAELVDVRPDGQPATATSSLYNPASMVAADGRHVVFTSPDGGLDPDGPVISSSSGQWAYVRDLPAGTTQLVSYDQTGDPVDVLEVAISGDGTLAAYIAQGDAASPTASGGFTSGFHIFMHDLASGEVTAVQTSDGQPVAGLNSGTHRPQVSADGRFIAFNHYEPLVPADTNDGSDTYVFDRQTGALEVVSVGTDGRTGSVAAGSNTSDFRGISGDGRLVAFSTSATDLVDDEVVQAGAVHLHDRGTGTTTLIARRPDGTPGVGQQGGSAVQVSDNGAWVVFGASEDYGNHRQEGCGVYRYEVATAALQRVDLGEVDPGAANCALGMDVADDGSVVFDEISTHHVHADPLNVAEVYRWRPS